MKRLVLNLDDDEPRAILRASVFAVETAETNLISAIRRHGFHFPHAGTRPECPAAGGDALRQRRRDRIGRA